MQRKLRIGPSFDDLRRTKERVGRERDGFPVFPDLEGILAGRSVHDPVTQRPFDRTEVARYVCSVLSTWAYADLDSMATIMTRLGLERCRCRSVAVSNHGALISATACLIQSESGEVALLAYRGTDPFDLSTWATSGDVNPSTVAVPEPAQSSSVATPAPAAEAPAEAVRAGASPQLGLGHAIANTMNAATQAASGVLTSGLGFASSMGAAFSSWVPPAALVIDAAQGFAQTATDLAVTGTRMVAAVVRASARIRAQPTLRRNMGPRVHAGFYRSQRACWAELADALHAATSGGGILPPDGKLAHANPTRSPLEHLYVTGHSLGAAMAILASYKIASDLTYERINAIMKEVHAFAPPMVGNTDFASFYRACDHERTHCYVFKNDVVPHLPPFLRMSLDFTHVGQFHGVDPEDAEKPANECSWVTAELPNRAQSASDLILAFDSAFGESLSISESLLSVLRSDALERIIAELLGSITDQRRYAIYDHWPTHYQACSQLVEHETEFGRDF